MIMITNYYVHFTYTTQTQIKYENSNNNHIGNHAIKW